MKNSTYWWPGMQLIYIPFVPQFHLQAQDKRHQPDPRIPFDYCYDMRSYLKTVFFYYNNNNFLEIFLGTKEKISFSYFLFSIISKMTIPFFIFLVCSALLWTALIQILV